MEYGVLYFYVLIKAYRNIRNKLTPNTAEEVQNEWKFSELDRGRMEICIFEVMHVVGPMLRIEKAKLTAVGDVLTVD